MKKDKLFITLEVFKWLFFLGIPLILFFAKCTTLFGIKGGAKFIVSCSGYIFGIIVYLIAKKLLFKNYFITLNGKITNYETQIETETDQNKIPLIEKALGKNLIIRELFNVIPTLLILGLLLVVFKGIENGLVTLYALVGLSLLSYGLGLGIAIFQHNNVKSKHRE